jgi:hypothetical protein
MSSSLDYIARSCLKKKKKKQSNAMTIPVREKEHTPGSVPFCANQGNSLDPTSYAGPWPHSLNHPGNQQQGPHNSCSHPPSARDMECAGSKAPGPGTHVFVFINFY